MQSLLPSAHFQPILFATIPQLHTPEVWTFLEQQGVIKELLLCKADLRIPNKEGGRQCHRWEVLLQILK